MVNEAFEVIDGQHRLLAATEMGVDIYYEIVKDLKKEDMILMNISRSWKIMDYMNYYCKNNYEEYLKLKSFMEEQNITLKVAITITVGDSKLKQEYFRNGEYKFSEGMFSESLRVCWNTIEFIKKMNGHSPYTTSARFWRALFMLTNHGDFDERKWMSNLTKMHFRISPKANIKDYFQTLTEVYNWRNDKKITLGETSRNIE